MSPIHKISLYTSFLLSFSAQLPSFELHATAKMTVDDFKERQLEEKFPMYFKGFNRTDMSHVIRDHAKDELFKPNPSIPGKLEALLGELKLAANPKTEKLQEELAKMIEDKSKHSIFAYVVTTARALMLISDKTEEEEQFFKTAGFSLPYTLINIADEADENIWQALVNWSNAERTNRDFDFHSSTLQYYSDPEKKKETLLAKRKQVSRTFFMDAYGKNEDVFGFLYLAWMYSKGTHPVPLTFQASTTKTHGIKMSPWGKFCHDLAHHEIDPAENIIENFSNHILNHYLSELRKNFKSFSQPEKEKYSISNLIEPVTEFAITVHEAYSEALTAIIEESIKGIETSASTNSGGEKPELSDEFKAFSAGAFVYTHENPTDLSRTLATSNLREIVASAIRPIAKLVELEKQESTDKTTVTSAGNEPTSLETKTLSATTPELPPIEELIVTSSITGESSLDDKEIVSIIQERPLAEFRGHYHYGSKLDKDEIASTSVKRNKFHIQVEFDMLDGTKIAYRINTQLTNRLNLAHDRQFLLPAKAILSKDFNYTIPTVPAEPQIEDDASQYDLAVLNCRKELNIGRNHLLSHFLKTATELSDKSSGETLSISDQYSVKYSHALRKLEYAFPSFTGGVQAFISAALKPAETN